MIDVDVLEEPEEYDPSATHHIVPIGDLRDNEVSEDCWCKPTQDEELPNLYVHHSMDGREAYESGERKL